MSHLWVRQYAAATVFYILSVLLFPVTLLGYVIWVGKGIFNWSASGVSGTAQGPLYARWFEHKLGTREDEPANRLMMVLPGIPRWGLRLGRLRNRNRGMSAASAAPTAATEAQEHANEQKSGRSLQ